MIDLKEIFPFEAIGPAIGGAIIWFGANYAVIGPDVIGPRLQEKYYAPMCSQAVETGREARAQREQSLIEDFNQRLGSYQDSVRTQTQNSALGFFQLFGAEGRTFINRHGSSIAGSVTSMTEAPLQARLAQEREAFLGQLEAEQAERRAQMKYDTPDQYCGCVIGEALGERIDLAAYSASLRIYTPPSIRNIESGAVFADSETCGAMPII